MSAQIIDRGRLQERDLTPKAFDVLPLDQYPAEDLLQLLTACAYLEQTLRGIQETPTGETKATIEERTKKIQALDLWGYRIREAYKLAINRQPINPTK